MVRSGSRRTGYMALLAAWTFGGCGADVSHSPLDEVVSALVTVSSDEVPRPRVLTDLDESADRWVELAPLAGVVSAWPTSSGGMLLESSEGVWSLSGQLSLAEAPLPEFPGRVHDVAAIGNDAFLVATQSGLQAVGPSGAFASPLQSALGAAHVRQLCGGHDAVWMTSDLGLHRWAEDQIQTVQIPGIETRDARIASGEWQAGTPAIWIASEGRIAALVSPGMGFQAHVEREGHPVEALRTDSMGHVWTLAGGRVHERDPQGIWRLLQFQGPVTGLEAHPLAAGVWIRLSDGSLIHGLEGAFRVITDVPPGAVATCDDLGNAWILGEDLHRVVPGRPATLSGVKEGGVIHGPAEVGLTVAFAELVGFVDALVGTQAVPVEASDDGWVIALDPESLGLGEHSLEVTVGFTDAAPDSHVSLEFTVEAPPTWSEDIQPIYQSSCSPCHSSSYSVHPLDSPEMWVEEIDSILWLISRGLMPEKPYAPLTGEQVILVEAWSVAGFPE